MKWFLPPLGSDTKCPWDYKAWTSVTKGFSEEPSHWKFSIACISYSASVRARNATPLTLLDCFLCLKMAFKGNACDKVPFQRERIYLNLAEEGMESKVLFF